MNSLLTKCRLNYLFYKGRFVSFIFGFAIALIIVSFQQQRPSIKLAEQSSQQVDNNLWSIPVNSDRDPFLVIFIFSSPKNLDRRNSIRETWLKLANDRTYQIKYFFVIGTFALSPIDKHSVDTENALHHDLLTLTQLKDSYESLTEKLKQSFRWLSKRSGDLSNSADYLLKVDDDSFVRIDTFYDELSKKHRQPATLPLYWGFFNGRASIKRKGQWQEKNWFLCERYLPYAVGGGYLISKSLVDFVATNSDQLSSYKNEDVSLGTWLSPLKINRLHDIRFDTEFQSRGCIDSYLIQHKQSPHEMRTKYRSLLNNGRLCHNGQIERRLVYEFNWNSLPSKCCTRNITMITSQ